MKSLPGQGLYPYKSADRKNHEKEYLLSRDPVVDKLTDIEVNSSASGRKVSKTSQAFISS